MKIFNVNIWVWLNESKVNKKGECPIIMRISIRSNRLNCSTGIRIRKENWDKENKAILNNKEKNNQLQSQIYEVVQHINFLRKERRLSIQTIKDLIHIKPQISVLKVVEQYELYTNSRTDLKISTLKSKETMFRRIKEFLQEFNLKYIEQINQIVVNQLFEWLNKNSCFERSKKIYNLLYNAFEYSATYNHINENPFRYAIKPKKKKGVAKEKLHLSKKEVKKISFLFLNERLRKVKDCFLLQCYTGVAYSDLRHFNKESIKEIQGQRLYISKRQKNNSQFVIPLLQEAENILDKYDWNLPVISNQKYNLYLKEIVSILNIEKKLTSHVARKTFGQIMLDNGYPIEAVSRMLGHSDINVTQKHYVDTGVNLVVNALISNNIQYINRGVV